MVVWAFLAVQGSMMHLFSAERRCEKIAMLAEFWTRYVCERISEVTEEKKWRLGGYQSKISASVVVSGPWLQPRYKNVSANVPLFKLQLK